MKNILVLVLVGWFLYIPKYSVTQADYNKRVGTFDFDYYRVEIIKSFATLTQGECPIYTKIDGRQIMVCGSHFIQEEN